MKVLLMALAGALASLTWDTFVGPRVSLTGGGLVLARAAYFFAVIFSLIAIMNSRIARKARDVRSKL